MIFLGAYATFFRLTAFQAVSFDTMATLEPAPAAPQKSAVVLLGVDLQALRTYGVKGASEKDSRLLDRIIFVKTLEKLKPLGTSAIGIDFLFQVPRNADTDTKLATAIKACGNVVVTGSWVSTSADKPPEWKPPLPAIAATAKAVASANTPPDEDGVIRLLPLREAGHISKITTAVPVEPFALAIAKIALHTEYISWEGNYARLNNARPFPNHDILVDLDGAMMVKPLKGPVGGSAFVNIPLTKFLELQEGKVPAELFKNKVVLIGTTDALYQDFHLSPLSRFSGAKIPGVEILATSVHDILEGRFLQPVPKAGILVVLALFVLLNAWAFSKRPVVSITLLAPIEVIGLLAASYALYQAGYLVSMVDLTVPLVGAAVIGAGWRTVAGREPVAVPVQAVPAEAQPEEKHAEAPAPITNPSLAPVQQVGEPTVQSIPATPVAPPSLRVVRSQALVNPDTDATVESAVPAPQAGSPFSPPFLQRFQIEKQLGKGGMGEVFLAVQTALDRKVAVKTLTSLGPAQIERFRIEGKLLSKLNHPRIVGVYDAGEDNGVPFLVCEYVEGESLRDFLRRGVPPLPKALAILDGILEGLALPHSQNILHRDIKPDNIFLTKTGEVKIGDFGLAKLAANNEENLTQVGAVMGTPAYMSPEQAQARSVDHRTDLYAVGMMAFEMFTGRTAFKGETALETLMKQVNDPLPGMREITPGLPEKLEAVVTKALAKNADERYQTAEELRAAFKAAKEEPVATVTVPVPSVPSRPVQRPSVKTAADALARYQIVKQIGEGAYGTVVAAKDKTTGQDVAIKFLKEQSADDIARFQREAAILRTLDHPGIVKILDAGVAGSKAYIVMELLTGATLEAVVKKTKISPKQALMIVSKVADALAYGHEKGIVHRDVKTANVFITKDKQIKLLDFGLAKPIAPGQTLTAQGMFMGTPDYIAPELINGNRPLPASDQYSLGVMAYLLIAGVPPFPGSEPMAVIMARLSTDPPPLRTSSPQLPENAEKLIMKTLQRNPAARFSDLKEFAAEARKVMQAM